MVSAAEQFRVDANQAAAAPQYQFGDFISGKWTDKKNNQNQIIANAKYEQDNLTAARAWEEYLSSHKYQMAVDDLKKAGLNPWLAVQNGVSGSAVSSNAGTGSSSGKSVSSNNTGKNAKDAVSGVVSSAIKILMMFAMFG